MIEMTVDSVRMGAVNTQRVVIFKEKGGRRRMSMVLSAAEADPIVTALKSKPEARPEGSDNAAKAKAAGLPLTHDLMTNIIETYNGKVRTATINVMDRNRYCASLVISVGDGEARFDCRVSDAVALAVRAGTTVFIEESAIEDGVAPAKASERPSAVLISTDDIECPECGGKTTIRAATKGLNTGKKFHVCNNYPECKGKVSIQYRGH